MLVSFQSGPVFPEGFGQKAVKYKDDRCLDTSCVLLMKAEVLSILANVQFRVQKMQPAQTASRTFTRTGTLVFAAQQ